MHQIKFCYILSYVVTYAYFTDSDPDDDTDIDTSAAMLYGLIHARFIITTNGLLAMVSIALCTCLYSKH